MNSGFRNISHFSPQFQRIIVKYLGNEGVKHNIKFEEQKNEKIDRKVLLEWNRILNY